MRAYPVNSLHRDVQSQRDDDLVARLDGVLATKLVGVLRGRRHHFLAQREEPPQAAAMFLAHSNAEQADADALAQRIVELEAEPGFSPTALAARSHVSFFEAGADVAQMAREDLDAARVAGEVVSQLLRFVGTNDVATRRVLLAIVEGGKAREAELSVLIAGLPPG